jgi:acyl transferase domain-containing protein
LREASIGALRKHLATENGELRSLLEWLASMPTDPAAVHAPRPAPPIAIIGLACRFPGAVDADAFWDLLAAGRDAVGEIPASRFAIERFYHPDPEQPGTICTRHGAFLDDIEQFDPGFFGIPPRAAAAIDPQQRLVLEVGWEALEQAAIAPTGLRNRPLGIFVGIAGTDYARRAFADPAAIDFYSGAGNLNAFAAGRLAYLLGAVGPAEAVDTACSSSLVAIHRACQALAGGDCELALAGGTHVIVGPENYLFLSRAKALSADGRSRAFADGADGFGRGEGCGMLVLKPLAAARRDGDRVLAVIRASAVNSDGPSAGLTVPSAAAQSRLLEMALARAGLTPADVDYLEAHGTGTALGDPIEVHAAGEVYATARPDDRPLLLGSVKSNIGHLEAAAGVAGVIKVVLAMQHGLIPAHLHCDTLNPRIPWARLPFRVVTAPTPWPRTRCIAGVSSFGMSGTNAHLLIEAGDGIPEASAPEQGAQQPAHVLPLSAKSGPALARLAARWVRWMQQHAEIDAADACATAALGRAHFRHRAAVSRGRAASTRPWPPRSTPRSRCSARPSTTAPASSPTGSTCR